MGDDILQGVAGFQEALAVLDILVGHGELFGLFLNSRAQPAVLVVLGLDDSGRGNGDDRLVAEGLQGLELRLLEGVASMPVV